MVACNHLVDYHLWFILLHVKYHLENSLYCMHFFLLLEQDRAGHVSTQ